MTEPDAESHHDMGFVADHGTVLGPGCPELLRAPSGLQAAGSAAHLIRLLYLEGKSPNLLDVTNTAVFHLTKKSPGVGFGCGSDIRIFQGEVSIIVQIASCTSDFHAIL